MRSTGRRLLTATITATLAAAALVATPAAQAADNCEWWNAPNNPGQCTIYLGHKFLKVAFTGDAGVIGSFTSGGAHSTDTVYLDRADSQYPSSWLGWQGTGRNGQTQRLPRYSFWWRACTPWNGGHACTGFHNAVYKR